VAKFLIIRFSSIGDIILTTPVIRCLKEQVENSEVHYLTKPSFASLLQNNPHIDKLLLLKENLNDTIREIKANHYDYIIDLHHNLRTFIIKNKTRILSFSFPKLNFQKALLVHFKINKLPKIHVVDRYFETLKLLAVENDRKGLELFLHPSDEIKPETLPEFLHKGYIAVVVGAKHHTKQIPESLLSKIISGLNYPAILLGDKNDFAQAETVIRESGMAIAYNACGKYSIMQSASLVKNATAVLTPDTGLMHIAAAFNKKIVSVWGNTIPEFGMYPYTDQENYEIMEVKNLSCRPCSKLGYDQCPKKHFNCMNKQSSEEIITSIKKFL
jgi:ADP-heptose:LPS heptosyltransferase